jgi:exonuclease III
MRSLFQQINQLDLIVSKYKPLIICLQELKTKKIQNYKDYTIFTKIPLSRTIDKGGVAVCVNKKINSKRIKLRTNLQAVAVEIHQPFKFVINSIYLPPKFSPVRRQVVIGDH